MEHGRHAGIRQAIDVLRNRHGRASIERAPFGLLPDSTQVSVFTLANGRGMTAKILDFGGIVNALHVPDRHGVIEDVVLGFDTLEPYLGASQYIGALIGRYGNRIARGRFTLDGRTHQLAANNGRHHLHGGPQGFDRVLWQAEVEGEELVLRYRSMDGEGGYPGTLDVTVRYRLGEDNELVMRYHAVTDQATPVNLTQHSYFNLAGMDSAFCDILGHEIAIEADRFIPIDADLIPTGVLAAVTGTPFDFRAPRAIGERIAYPDKQLRYGSGYDHCYALSKPAPGTMTRAARVCEPLSGRVLEVFTQEPGLQFYSGNFLDGALSGKGQVYTHRSGFCLEPQHFPDSPNQPGFPDTILRPGDTYETESRWRFSVEN